MYSVKHYYVLYHFRILRAWNPTFSKNIYVAPTNYWGQYAKYFVYVNRLIYMPKILRVLVTQSCPTLCDPLDCSLPGFSICGIFQARILEWIAISFSRGSSRPRDWTQGFPGGLAGKESACSVGDLGSNPGLVRSPREGNGYSLQYSDWRIPWTVESMGSQRVRHDWATFTFFLLHRKEALYHLSHQGRLRLQS